MCVCVCVCVWETRTSGPATEQEAGFNDVLSGMDVTWEKTRGGGGWQVLVEGQSLVSSHIRQFTTPVLSAI